MNIFKSLSDRIFSSEFFDFDELTLEVFQYQAKQNSLYKDFISHLGVDATNVRAVDQIPFLPIEFFKTHEVKSGTWSSAGYFESSGTTGTTPSRHHYAEVDSYLMNCVTGFWSSYGHPEDFVWLALLPSYLERSNSGLVAMANYFIQISNHSESGFYLNEHEVLLNVLRELRESQKKVVLLGVTFALLDLAEVSLLEFPELIVMETGGMKGRREEMVRKDVHSILKQNFGVQRVHSEYGMTELFSQAYSFGEGVFNPSRNMKVLCRDMNDPRSILTTERSGGLNVIDLANLHSCSFIETKDIGKVYSNGSFEVLGRMDNSDIRGCNLMLS